MKIAVVKEKDKLEQRVAATFETIAEYVKLGFSVSVETGAGDNAGISDEDYKKAGAKIVKKAEEAYKSADLILKVQPPTPAEIKQMKKNAILVGLLGNINDKSLIKKYAESKLTAFAMEYIPRITRAQSMDVLSSQSNLAGYKAVIDGVAQFGKAMPMMMTAAGKITPAKVLILGAGVAGLQAIATAKRLGAIVSAFDVRPAAKEQVESLGASFIEVANDDAEQAETKGGYAKEMSKEYQKKQEQLIHDTIKEQDLVITTALIPNKPAPLLIPEKMVKDMKQGSVIVDMASSAGGNCQVTKSGEVITKHGVTIIGYTNIPSRLAKDASRLYAQNLLNFIKPMVNAKLKKLKPNFEDEIQQSCLLTHDGNIAESKS